MGQKNSKLLHNKDHGSKRTSSSRNVPMVDDDSCLSIMSSPTATAPGISSTIVTEGTMTPLPMITATTIPIQEDAHPIMAPPSIVVVSSSPSSSLLSSPFSLPPESPTNEEEEEEESSILTSLLSSISSDLDPPLVLTNGVGTHTVGSTIQDDTTTTTPTTSSESSFRVVDWDKKTLYSDWIAKYHPKQQGNVIMLFECPSSCDKTTNFFNSQVYKYHDWPPTITSYKSILAPCRYSMMNGNAYPSYLDSNVVPSGLLQHWQTYIPGFVQPRFTNTITDQDIVYAYLPVEHIKHHLNHPHTHYHISGKDALPLMTDKTTQLLANTQDVRPCVVKTTHSMASKGIFVIENDTDEEHFNQFLKDSGNPTYIITEYIDIARNVACHFFIPKDPTHDIVWFGSNENRPDGTSGGFSGDSTILYVPSEQEYLKQLQLPFVRDVVKYCRSLGFWGFCGVDVLVDRNGRGYLVDVNPRTTGSAPSIMVGHRLYEKYGYQYCLFRRSSNYEYPGTAQQLIQDVDKYNTTHEGTSIIILNSFYQEHETSTLIQLAVYSNTSLDDCEAVLNRFAVPRRHAT